MIKNSKIHYGWFILFSSFMITSFYMCIIMNCPGLFVVPVSEGLNISRSQFSLNTTVLSIGMVIVSLNAGKIFSKFKIRTIMIISSIILPIAYAGYGLVGNIYLFYAISFVLGVCLALCGLIPISTLITKWFVDNRGLAMGIAFTGSGLGGLFLQPLIGHLIVNIGWENTYLVLAGLMFVCVVPFIILFIKDSPEEMNIKPYIKQGKKETQEEIKEVPVMDEGLTLKEALKTSQLWVFLIVVALTTAMCSSFIQQTVPYLTDIGFSVTAAANFGALSLGALAIGKILLGQIYDYTGVLKGTVLSLSLLAITFIAFLFAENSMFLYAGIVASGLGIAFSTVGFSIITLRLFGKKEYGAIYGIVSSAASLGSAVGSPSANIIYDLTSSYKTTWTIWAVLTALCILACVYILKSRVKTKN